MTASMRVLFVATAAITNPRISTLQVRSQYGHDQPGLKAKTELRVIQAKNRPSRMMMGWEGIRFGSLDISQDRIVTTAMARFRGSVREKPNASRWGCIREN